MTKLQAAMRDQAAKKWAAAKVYFRVGSAFKGCLRCGEVNDKGMFTTGTDVVRAYRPKEKGWTYMCMTCGAKDDACWQDAWDIGQEPRILPRSDISPYQGERGTKVYTQGQYKKEMRNLHFLKDTVAKHSKLTERELHIMALEKQLKEIQSILESRSGR